MLLWDARPETPPALQNIQIEVTVVGLWNSYGAVMVWSFLGSNFAPESQEAQEVARPSRGRRPPANGCAKRS